MNVNGKNDEIRNPFRPGAGHSPPYLAGRDGEVEEFRRLLDQDVITDNMVLTGLRGVGKTVLLDEFKPIAQQANWAWIGTDLSESSSISEDRIARRLMTDLAPITSSLTVGEHEIGTMVLGQSSTTIDQKLDYRTLGELYDHTPGLVVDKLSVVLDTVWQAMSAVGKRGIVFSYDEAQTMADHPKKNEYPLALMLQVFQSAQRRGIPFLLVLTGLPTLFSKLVESRTYAERMFHVVFLDRLGNEDSRDAILKPLENTVISFRGDSVDSIVTDSGGYPYFIQFICREVTDLAIAGVESVPADEILSKLDADFFAGRWQRLTDRQRELLSVSAQLPSCDKEFTVQEITGHSATVLEKGFTASHANQMLALLCDKGLVYKNRHGKYSFAVPLLDRFIKRQAREG